MGRLLIFFLFEMNSLGIFNKNLLELNRQDNAINKLSFRSFSTSNVVMGEAKYIEKVGECTHKWNLCYHQPHEYCDFNEVSKRHFVSGWLENPELKASATTLPSKQDNSMLIYECSKCPAKSCLNCVDNPFVSHPSPLDQFMIRDLLSIDAPILADIHLAITNIGLYLIIAAGIALTLSILASNFYKLSSNNWSISQETIYDTVKSIVINQINPKRGQIYFPFIYALFVFILINNLIGMVPYSFAPTSHFILTFALSFTVVFGSTILGFIKHGLKFFSLFVPSGCPLGLLPLLVLIEFISYLARNISLGLRLAANIMSGHMLLSILSGFTYNIMTSGLLYFIIGLLPLAFIIAFSGLELGIAFIQAQVFVVLTCSYIKDGLDLH